MPKNRRDGTGGIYRDGNGWRAQVRTFDPFTGKSRTIRRRAATRDDARVALRELLADAPAPVADPRTTVAAWLDRWAEVSLPVAGLAPRTVEMYRSLIINPLKPSLENVTLAEFTPSAAETWLQRLAATPKIDRRRDPSKGNPPGHVSTGTQRNAFNCLKRALDAAERDGLIPRNPLTVVTRPAVRRKSMPATPANAVDDVILPATAEMRIGPLVAFVALTGCRLGEALGLRWEDVDLDAATATIRYSSATAETTKTDEPRTIPLVPDVAEALRVARARQRADRLAMGPGWQDSRGLVFTTGSGTPMDAHNARRDLQRVLRRHGLPTERPFHSMRHGLAARLLARNVPLPVVSAILGHRSIKTTADVYGHIQPVMHADDLAKAMGR